MSFAPVSGGRLQMYCVNRAVLVSVWGGAASGALRKPRCFCACFGGGAGLRVYCTCANRAVPLPAPAPVLGTRLRMYCAKGADLVPVFGGAASD